MDVVLNRILTIVIQILLMLFCIGAFHVILALVLQSIAKKLKYKKPTQAWIPIGNAFLFPILAKKNWKWGYLFIIPWVLLLLGIIILIITISQVGFGFGTGLLIIIVLYVFTLIETLLATPFLWIIFKRRKFPSWLSLYFIFVLLLPSIILLINSIDSILLMLVSFIYFLLFIGSFILLGLVAWLDRE